MTLAHVIGSFTNSAPVTSKAVVWGKLKEPLAQQAAEEVVQLLLTEEGRAVRAVSFRYPGGVPIRGHPYFIASVDGLADIEYEDDTRETMLIELKCPVVSFYEGKYTTNIPPGYYIQIQCCMCYLRLHEPKSFGRHMRRCLFLQWDRNACRAAVYGFNAPLFHEHIVLSLQALYFEHVLPRLALVDCAVLPRNSLVLPRTLINPVAEPIEEERAPPRKRIIFQNVRVTVV